METQWLSASEAAKALGVSPTTVRRRAKNGQLEQREGPNQKIQFAVTLAQPAQNEKAAPSRASKTKSSAKPQAKPETGSAMPDAFLKQHQPEKFTSATTKDEDVSRYQKLAGASVMLAQKRADDAHELLVHTRAQVLSLRRLVWASWGFAAGMALVCVVAMLHFGSVRGEVTKLEGELDEAQTYQRLLLGQIMEERTKLFAEQNGVDYENAVKQRGMTILPPPTRSHRSATDDPSEDGPTSMSNMPTMRRNMMGMMSEAPSADPR